jgi:lipoate-protein ligase A
MHFLDLTLPTAAENMALDEALLQHCEAEDCDAECLRLWEPTGPVVVLGRSSVAEREVDLATCRRDGVSVLRRISGGCAIYAAPGCLMYALVLSYARRPELRAIHAAHRYVLDTLAMSLGRLVPGLTRAGISDLVLQNRKVSGNRLRCQRTHLLYHGTLLYGMELAPLVRHLRMPPREPDYRAGRGHEAFLSQLPVTRNELALAVKDTFEAFDPLPRWPQARTQRLVAERYADDQWNLGEVGLH